MSTVRAVTIPEPAVSMSVGVGPPRSSWAPTRKKLRHGPFSAPCPSRV
ncbi:hypothetical protein Rrhod_1736 [Rhodococcus rhodnii LMG 5362]|uniref:Uncharacterized protein n=1 Tax=Rhodococcus rhodnii LMG 5362 TaxID=1273125 RepID=R7WNF0_9NOCA|nr:hypothetical protein Rrhod_1736 [Rhodococcus rhodnii LMG 5362]